MTGINNNLVLSIREISQITDISLDGYNAEDLSVVINMGTITKISLIDERLVVICFEHGEIRFEADRESLLTLSNQIEARSLGEAYD